MGKLVESTFVTIDGGIGDPQIWGPPYWGEEHSGYAAKLLFGADALLLGRETYEGFAASWPERSGDDYTDRINAMPKYVASNSLKDSTWNSTVLSGDVADQVADLKQEQSLLKFGTGALDRTLVEHGLVDEFHFWVYPTFSGGVDRLQIDGLDTTHLQLHEVTTFESGIVVLALAPK
jgi:dihydrofolate reductase